MKKIPALLFMFLLYSGRLYAQGLSLVTSDPLELCNSSNPVTFTVSPYDPGFTYEWQFDSYDNFQSNGFDDFNTFGFGQGVSFLPSSYNHGTTRITCYKKDVNGLILDYGNEIVRYSPDIVPYFIDYSNCGYITVPFPYMGSTNGLNMPVWAAWYKDGVNTGIQDITYWYPTSGNYQLKIALTCGDTISTPVILINNNIPNPLISASGPLTFCQGLSVTLSVAIDDDYTYQWKKNGVNISGADSSSIAVTTGGSYSVTVTNNFGCNINSSNIQVTVQTGAFITASDTVACSGDTIILSCTAASTYKWKKNNTLINGATSQVYKATQSGTYKVITTGLTCNTSKDVALSFHAAPSVTISAGSSLNIRSGTGVSLSASALNATTYQWYQNGNIIPGQITSSIFANQAGTYKCAVSNGVCEIKSNIKTVTVTSGNQLPQKVLTLQPNGITGKDAWIYNVQPGTNYGNSSVIYATWYNSGGTLLITRSLLQFDLGEIPASTIINSANLSLYSNQSGNNYPNNATYLDPAVGAWNEISVTWNNQPLATTYNRAIIAGSSNPNQDLSNINVKGAVVVMINKPAKNYGWRFWLQNEVSGGNMILASSDYGTQPLRPKLVINYAYAKMDTSNALNFCNGDSVRFTTNTGPYTYKWTKNGNVISGATSSGYTVKSSGNYAVTITDPGGATVVSKTKTVTVYSLPGAAITASGPTTFCSGDSVKLMTNTGGSLTYTWKKNGNTIAGATTANYTAKTPGSYKVIVTNGNGCSKTSPTISVSVPCKTSSYTGENISVKLFPNPSSNEFFITAYDEHASAVLCNVYDIRGRKITGFTIQPHHEFLFGTDLQPGIYTIELRSDHLYRKIIAVKL